MKLNIYWGVFEKYIVVAYNRIATTVTDFTGRAIITIIVLLALRHSPIGFRGARTSVYRGTRTSVYLL